MSKDARKRQEEVLSLIITHYTGTAEPVGSRFISRKLGLSSATIRNVMADLEDLGFLTHPHTSAGRIPTDKGYRYYIDSLMKVRSVNDNILKLVREQYHQTMRSIEDVLERTAHLMSQLTNYVGLTMLPHSSKLYLDGTSHIVEQPEFKDIKKLYMILRCLEEKANIISLLSNEIDERLIVHIGREIHVLPLNECSVITSGYKIKGKSAGRVGVIGPKRMVYDKVIPTVELLADKVSEIFGNIEI